MADYVYGTSAFQLVDDISNPVLYQSTTRDAIMAGLKVIDGNAGKIVDTAINSQAFNPKAAFSVLNGMKDSGVVMKTAADARQAPQRRRQLPQERFRRPRCSKLLKGSAELK